MGGDCLNVGCVPSKGAEQVSAQELLNYAVQQGVISERERAVLECWFTLDEDALAGRARGNVVELSPLRGQFCV